jgi:hypothetical protein
LRSRFAILLMLVLGFALSGAGAGFAVSGLAQDETVSSDTAYAPPGGPTLAPTAEATPESGGVAGETEESTPSADSEEADDSQVAGDQDTTPAAPAAEAAVQTTRQIGADSSELPLTGWAAIPVLLLGLVLLAVGFTLRRNARPTA